MGQDLRHRLARERRTRGKQVIENRPERIDITLRADGAAPGSGLFGRHEVGRAQDLTGQSQSRVESRVLRVDHALGQAKVGNAGLVERINQNV